MLGPGLALVRLPESYTESTGCSHSSHLHAGEDGVLQSRKWMSHGVEAEGRGGGLFFFSSSL